MKWDESQVASADASALTPQHYCSLCISVGVGSEKKTVYDRISERHLRVCSRGRGAIPAEIRRC
jgi:hypothetical protein